MLLLNYLLLWLEWMFVLDYYYSKQLAVNEAILEEEDGDVDGISLEEQPAVPRTRNRPKREVEVPSK
jgi:hypothetical protein